MEFTIWDVALLTVIPLQATIMAYIYRPQIKAILSIIPLPFTLATLSLGLPIDGTNVAGLLLIMFFVHSVRIMNYKFHIHIIISIFLASFSYCLFGSLLAPIIPHSNRVFWILLSISFLTGGILHIMTPQKIETGHRSPMPVMLKWIVITGVIFVLIVIKKNLQGFMTVFPMVGVVASYELRHSLWVYCRNIQLFVLLAAPMMLVIHATQQKFGLGMAIAAGWITLLIVAVPVYMIILRK
ncbi:MAG: hypothetical protein JXB48_14490 [Candidatus Latescibacteria bacterium]|nr:hypothetical protein [Candidatus Latescibacterota bacterium]